MGIPQVPSQLKRGPAEALRAAFAGIGKILMAADRPDQATVPASRRASGPAPRATADQSRHRKTSGRGSRRGAGAAPAPAPRFRSLDKTGNVRLLTPEELARNADGARPADAGLPLPGYDGLSIASIRARMRGLDPAQLRMLIDHERASAQRPDVLAMLERRLKKLESGQ